MTKTEREELLELARGLTRETLHGAPPIKSTMRLAVAVLELLGDDDRDLKPDNCQHGVSSGCTFGCHETKLPAERIGCSNPRGDLATDGGNYTPSDGCQCTSEQGDSDCPVHPTCHACGELLTDEDGTPRIAGLRTAHTARLRGLDAEDALRRRIAELEAARPYNDELDEVVRALGGVDGHVSVTQRVETLVADLECHVELMTLLRGDLGLEGGDGQSYRRAVLELLADLARATSEERPRLDAERIARLVAELSVAWQLVADLRELCGDVKARLEAMSPATKPVLRKRLEGGLEQTGTECEDLRPMLRVLNLLEKAKTGAGKLPPVECGLRYLCRCPADQCWLRHRDLVPDDEQPTPATTTELERQVEQQGFGVVVHPSTPADIESRTVRGTIALPIDVRPFEQRALDNPLRGTVDDPTLKTTDADRAQLLDGGTFGRAKCQLTDHGRRVLAELEAAEQSAPLDPQAVVGARDWRSPLPDTCDKCHHRAKMGSVMAGFQCEHPKLVELHIEQRTVDGIGCSRPPAWCPLRSSGPAKLPTDEECLEDPHTANAKIAAFERSRTTTDALLDSGGRLNAEQAESFVELATTCPGCDRDLTDATAPVCKYCEPSFCMHCNWRGIRADFIRGARVVLIGPAVFDMVRTTAAGC